MKKGDPAIGGVNGSVEGCTNCICPHFREVLLFRDWKLEECHAGNPVTVPALKERDEYCLRDYRRCPSFLKRRLPEDQ